MDTKVTLRRRLKGRGQDAKGRSKAGERYVKLSHYVLDCEAYRSMKPCARALYTELRRRFNGLNNGRITLSVREAAAELHIAKDTASKAFTDLQAKGFIRIGRPGSFHYKTPHATEWILTEEDYAGQTATKEFMRWRPPQKK